MNATQRYELIRPILQKQKTPKQVHQETDVPLSTIYRYLNKFQQSNGQVEALADKSSASHTHPHWLTETQKSMVRDYKRHHPCKSSRQIAKDLTETGVLKISYHSVADILKQRDVTSPPFCQRLLNSMT